MSSPTADADVYRKFVTALPYRARNAFPLDWRTMPAIRACAEQGQDIAQLAVRISNGLERRTKHDTRGLLIMRLLKATGLETDQEEAE
jgi:hypothetical protein